MYKQVLIGSFNMSFASDMGKLLGSEKHFLAQTGETPRSYWKNSLVQIQQFFNQGEIPKCLGLQELNNVCFTKGNPFTKDAEGFQGVINGLGIEQMPPELQKTVGTPVMYNGNKYSYVVLTVEFNQGNPTIMTVWENAYFGRAIYSCGTDLQSIKWIKDGNKMPKDKKKKAPNVAGRPITLTLTDRGFVLINLHNVNDTSDTNLSRFRESFNFCFSEFRECIKGLINGSIDSSKIFIMGDFNDPYGYLTGKGLDINGSNYTSGKHISCCYNYNSSCQNINVTLADGTKEEDFLMNKTEKVQFKLFDPDIFVVDLSGIKIMDEHKRIYKNIPLYYQDLYKDKPVLHIAHPGECFQPVHMDLTKGFTPEAIAMNEERSKISSYRFYGDYCLGLDVVESGTFRKKVRDESPKSTQSDHEFVYGIFNVGNPKSSSFGNSSKIHYYRKFVNKSPTLEEMSKVINLVYRAEPNELKDLNLKTILENFDNVKTLYLDLREDELDKDTYIPINLTDLYIYGGRCDILDKIIFSLNENITNVTFISSNCDKNMHFPESVKQLTLVNCGRVPSITSDGRLTVNIYGATNKGIGESLGGITINYKGIVNENDELYNVIHKVFDYYDIPNKPVITYNSFGNTYDESTIEGQIQTLMTQLSQAENMDYAKQIFKQIQECHWKLFEIYKQQFEEAYSRLMNGDMDTSLVSTIKALILKINTYLGNDGLSGEYRQKCDKYISELLGKIIEFQTTLYASHSQSEGIGYGTNSPQWSPRK